MASENDQKIQYTNFLKLNSNLLGLLFVPFLIEPEVGYTMKTNEQSLIQFLNHFINIKFNIEKSIVSLHQIEYKIIMGCGPLPFQG